MHGKEAKADADPKCECRVVVVRVGQPVYDGGMIRPLLIAACTVLLSGAMPLRAQESSEGLLPLDGAIAADGGSVVLSWFEASGPGAPPATVRRRRLGTIGAGTWQTIAPSLSLVRRFTDDTIRPGVAYEYQVMRTGRDIIDVGYWATGVNLPALTDRGHAHVIVDETVAGPLGPHLARFERDLVGDGWQVSRMVAPRGGSDGPAGNLMRAAALKEALVARHADDPFARHAAILVGHVPVVMSGRANPDGHDPKPHATDLFYADMDGRWTIDARRILLDSRLPSDFIEMQVGRIDFSNVSGNDPARELHLLRAYFNKNHHWRHGLLGDLRNAYGSGEWLEAERYGLRNIVGPAAVTEGGHHDVGEEMPWLWGVDFGDWNGGNYAESYANKAVFALNFGSGKQNFQAPSNPMTALLAQPWYTIAVGWGARPAWWLHHMALGGTIGDVHMRTVNNGMAARPYRETMDYFPTGQYLWRNPIWVNLLGDPTTHAFVLAPATRVRAEPDGQGVTVSWAPSDDPDVIGYKVWRRQGDDARFRLVSGETPLAGPGFHDASPESDARYMVRAYGLKRVHAGSFHTLSQGSFADIATPPLQAEDMQMTGHAGETLELPQAFSEPRNETIHAFVVGPEQGDLFHDGANWRYRPPAGFSGTVRLRFSVSDALQTDEGLLTIEVVAAR